MAVIGQDDAHFLPQGILLSTLTCRGGLRGSLSNRNATSVLQRRKLGKIEKGKKSKNKIIQSHGKPLLLSNQIFCQENVFFAPPPDKKKKKQKTKQKNKNNTKQNVRAKKKK